MSIIMDMVILDLELTALVIGILKNLIKNIYYSIPHQHFVLYIREAEFRRVFKMLPKEKRLTEIYTVFNYIRDLKFGELYTEEELYEITNKL